MQSNREFPAQPHTVVLIAADLKWRELAQKPPECRDRQHGGISAIAISHPHYYSSMIEWSRAFDCPVLLHAADRQWVMRQDPAIEFWEGETKEIGHGLTLIRCGGHFDGGTVLHWPEGADGKGVVLSGDILQVVQDRRWVSFMYSYPNLIPLPASTVRRIVSAVESYEFDRIYGAWWGRVVFTDAKAAVKRSADRYVRAIQE
jgi:glyoxylase-like metal-dependent hydrolase (beta-lactamase superfamily II)